MNTVQRGIVGGVVTLCFAITPACAQQGQGVGQGGPQGIHDPGTGGNATSVQAQNQNQERVQVQTVSGTTTPFGSGDVVRARNQEELRQQVENQERVYQAAAATSTSRAERIVNQNQNQVRATVQALLAAEDLVGGIGPQVSAIAREFNASVNATVEAETRIRGRGLVQRMFVGGDDAAAATILAEADRNRDRIREMDQLLADCAACDDPTREYLQDRIRLMEQDQDRLRALAEGELARRGFFGWVAQLFGGE